MSVNTDDSGSSQNRFSVDMLMTVDQHLRFSPCYVGIQSIKAIVYSIFFIVNAPRGIVRKKNINRRKSRQEILDIPLVVQKMTTRLIFL